MVLGLSYIQTPLMKRELDEDILRLIIQHLDGTITQEDQLSLEEWLVDSENKEAFEELRSLWKDAPKAAHFAEANVQKDYETLKRKINAPRRRRIWYWASAASILILATIGYYSLNSTNHPQPIEHIATTGVEQIGLSDGTVVHLNEGASLIQNGDYGLSDRRVTLIGEAFFEVAKNPDKPFFVKTKATETKVLGTAFNIRETKDATVLSVEHGKVSFSAKAQTLILSQNDAGVYHANTQLVNKQKAGLNYLSWKTGILTFNRTPAAQVFADISKLYNIEIEILKPIDQEFTSTFKNETLEQVLEEVSLVLGLSITRENNKVYIQ